MGARCHIRIGWSVGYAILFPACLAMSAEDGLKVFIAFGTITPTSEELVSRLPSIMFTTVQSTATVIDMSITSGLIVLLWRSRGDAQFRMRTVIHRLLILSLSTGVWTSLFSILTVVTMLAFPNTLIYVGLYFPLCPLYCNTVLVNLNARQVIEKLERRPTRESITLYRETDSTVRIVPAENLPAINYEGHELAEAQTLRCRCQSETYRHDVEAGVQTMLNAAVVDVY
ncbi:hypothetical protein JVU11DRAFT_7150 [Chiua virens]|nr:hypothetical protein JVU11DRAFT_7150 [Chiua virens]